MLLNNVTDSSIWLYDGLRAMDYLASRTDLLDPSRLGMAGCSGGGTQVIRSVLGAAIVADYVSVPSIVPDYVSLLLRSTSCCQLDGVLRERFRSGFHVDVGCGWRAALARGDADAPQQG